MATIKSFTDIEQSKKLAEILPLESADMYYFTIIRDYPYSQGKIKTIAKIMDGSFSSDYDTPCWSLAALLELLPKRLQIVDNVYELSVYFYGLYYWNTINGNLCFEAQDKDNLVDACVAMIEKLNELNLL